MTDIITSANGNVWKLEEFPFGFCFPDKAQKGYKRNISDGGILDVWAMNEEQINTFEKVIDGTPKDARIYAVAAWHAALEL